MRNILVILAGLAAGTAADGQPPTRPAAPIGREALDRLNLRADWNAFVPVSGKKDGIVLIQPVDDQQVFVETKAGLLVALDARTGRQQWSYKFPNSFSGNEQVAVNPLFCYAVSIGKLYCFNRFTGALMLEQDLREAFPHREETPMTGPVADTLHVYIQMASGTLICYKMPKHLRYLVEDYQFLESLPDDIRKLPKSRWPKEYLERLELKDKSREKESGQDARNYGTSKMPPSSATDDSEYRVRAAQPDRAIGVERDLGTPSISALHSVVPPYQLNRDRPVQSVSVVPSLAQPNRLIPDHQMYNQQSPSVSSQSALYRLNEDSSLRAGGDKFSRQWRYLMPQRALGGPVLIDLGGKPGSTILWASTEGSTVVKLGSTWTSEQAKGPRELRVDPQRFTGNPLSPIVGPYGGVGFVPLDSGKLECLGLISGELSVWSAPVGGQMSNTPIVGADAVYASGPRSGVVKVDAKSGDVKWRTAPEVDQVLAVNREHLYARDNRGRLTVYATNGRPDPRTHFLRSSATLDLPEFTLGVSNDKTDRILLGGENGLIVCLRDAAATYAKPVRIAPPVILLPPPAPKPAEPPMGEPKN